MQKWERAKIRAMYELKDKVKKDLREGKITKTQAKNKKKRKVA